MRVNLFSLLECWGWRRILGDWDCGHFISVEGVTWLQHKVRKTQRGESLPLPPPCLCHAVVLRTLGPCVQAIWLRDSGQVIMAPGGVSVYSSEQRDESMEIVVGN